MDVFRRRSGELIRKHNEAAVAAYEQRLPEGAEKPFAYGMCYSKLFWIFMIGNLVGFVLETLYALAMPPHKFELRVSVVFGRLSLSMGLEPLPLRCSSIRCTTRRMCSFFGQHGNWGGFEYLCSFLQQVMFGTVSWEYSDSALNIGGRTNLMYSFSGGFWA